MQKDQLIVAIREALAEVAKLPSIDAIDNLASLREDYGLDSMSSLTFLLLLEEKVSGFMVNAETLEERHLQNVLSVAEYIEAELKIAA
jgi:acyl carrier protein